MASPAESDGPEMLDFEDFKEQYQKVPVEEYSNNVLEVVPEPVVSVHVSTYQHADFIRDCLEGVLMQETDFPIEIIIGEDESDDGTREICKEYADRHPDKIRLFLHRRENNISIHGQPTGRFQFTYSQFVARGKYIAICEGDDYWTDPTKLQRQVDLLEANPSLAGSFHKTKDVDYEKGEVVEIRAENTPDIVSAEDTICKGTHFHTSSFVYSRNNIEWPEWSPKFVSGDMILFSVIADRGDLAKIDRVMSVRRQHKGGLTKTAEHRSKFHERRIRLMKKMNEWHGGKFDSKLKEVIGFHERHAPNLFQKIRMKVGIRTRARKILSWIEGVVSNGKCQKF